MMTDNTDPRLLFCIGAQKAGTTWLFRHLEKYPQVHFHRVKEQQFWNNIRFSRDRPNRDLSSEALVKKLTMRRDQIIRKSAERPRDKNLKGRSVILEEVAREKLAPTYDFIGKRFDGMVPSQWRL